MLDLSRTCWIGLLSSALSYRTANGALIVAGGLGSTTGAIVAATFLTLLPEGLRSAFTALGGGNASLAQKVDQIRMPIYGLLLVIFIIYMPKGILGKLLELLDRRRPGTPPPGRLQPASEAAD